MVLLKNVFASLPMFTNRNIIINVYLGKKSQCLQKDGFIVSPYLRPYVIINDSSQGVLSLDCGPLKNNGAPLGMEINLAPFFNLKINQLKKIKVPNK